MHRQGGISFNLSHAKGVDWAYFKAFKNILAPKGSPSSAEGWNLPLR